MCRRTSSLLTGRHGAPLTQEEIRRATNTFLGLDNSVSARYEEGARTVFRVAVDDIGNEYGEIVFGPDIYPGSSLVDPNSALSLDAAAAHELTHYYRWKDMVVINSENLEHVDEALTSLQAILRYGGRLNDNDIRQLASDAIQRLQLFVREQFPDES